MHRSIGPEISKDRNRIRDFLPALTAAALFGPLFRFGRIGPLDFWWAMSMILIGLILIGSAWDGGWIRGILHDFHSRPARNILLGILSAVLLYGVFLAGNALSRSLLPFAAEGIRRVYAFKGGVSPLRIAVLMGLVIGPGEELFWRGFVQHRWQVRFGDRSGFLLAAGLYTLVHIPSGNPMLILAAGVCGLYWGWLYFRFRSILLVITSHTLWDLEVFLLIPFFGVRHL